MILFFFALLISILFITFVRDILFHYLATLFLIKTFSYLFLNLLLLTNFFLWEIFYSSEKLLESLFSLINILGMKEGIFVSSFACDSGVSNKNI